MRTPRTGRPGRKRGSRGGAVATRAVAERLADGHLDRGRQAAAVGDRVRAGRRGRDLELGLLDLGDRDAGDLLWTVAFEQRDRVRARRFESTTIRSRTLQGSTPLVHVAVTTIVEPSTRAAKLSIGIGWTSSWPGFGTTNALAGSPGAPGSVPTPVLGGAVTGVVRRRRRRADGWSRRSLPRRPNRRRAAARRTRGWRQIGRRVGGRSWPRETTPRPCWFRSARPGAGLDARRVGRPPRPRSRPP